MPTEPFEMNLYWSIPDEMFLDVPTGLVAISDIRPHFAGDFDPVHVLEPI